jgi:hypothetical protein
VRRGARGSATIEVVAGVPALALAALVAWYAAAGTVAAIQVQEELRRAGLERLERAGGTPAEGPIHIEERRRLRPLPLLPALEVRSRVAVPGR